MIAVKMKVHMAIPVYLKCIFTFFFQVVIVYMYNCTCVFAIIVVVATYITVKVHLLEG